MWSFERNDFLTFEELHGTAQLGPGAWLEYQGVVSAIPSWVKARIKEESADRSVFDQIEPKVVKLGKDRQQVRTLYRQIKHDSEIACD